LTSLADAVAVAAEVAVETDSSPVEVLAELRIVDRDSPNAKLVERAVALFRTRTSSPAFERSSSL